MRFQQQRTRRLQESSGSSGRGPEAAAARILRFQRQQTRSYSRRSLLALEAGDQKLQQLRSLVSSGRRQQRRHQKSSGSMGRGPEATATGVSGSSRSRPEATAAGVVRFRQEGTGRCCRIRSPEILAAGDQKLQ